VVGVIVVHDHGPRTHKVEVPPRHTWWQRSTGEEEGIDLKVRTVVATGTPDEGQGPVPHRPNGGANAAPLLKACCW